MTTLITVFEVAPSVPGVCAAKSVPVFTERAKSRQNATVVCRVFDNTFGNRCARVVAGAYICLVGGIVILSVRRIESSTRRQPKRSWPPRSLQRGRGYARRALPVRARPQLEPSIIHN